MDLHPFGVVRILHIRSHNAHVGPHRWNLHWTVVGLGTRYFGVRLSHVELADDFAAKNSLRAKLERKFNWPEEKIFFSELPADEQEENIACTFSRVGFNAANTLAQLLNDATIDYRWARDDRVEIIERANSRFWLYIGSQS